MGVTSEEQTPLTAEAGGAESANVGSWRTNIVVSALVALAVVGAVACAHNGGTASVDPPQSGTLSAVAIHPRGEPRAASSTDAGEPFGQRGFERLTPKPKGREAARLGRDDTFAEMATGEKSGEVEAPTRIADMSAFIAAAQARAAEDKVAREKYYVEKKAEADAWLEWKREEDEKAADKAAMKTADEERALIDKALVVESKARDAAVAAEAARESWKNEPNYLKMLEKRAKELEKQAKSARATFKAAAKDAKQDGPEKRAHVAENTMYEMARRSKETWQSTDAAIESKIAALAEKEAKEKADAEAKANPKPGDPASDPLVAAVLDISAIKENEKTPRESRPDALLDGAAAATAAT